MDSKEIQKRVDAIAKAMLAKGLREPTAVVRFESDKLEFFVHLNWKDVTKVDGFSRYSSGEYEFIRAPSVGEALAKADEFVAGLPSAGEARMKQFMGALANVIDLGRSNGVEVEFLNPLQATMKKLSDNILTDQRVVVAAE